MNKSESKSGRFSESAIELLTKAGWHEGRSVLSQLTLPGNLERLHAADAVLSEFGGLKIGKPGRGITQATSSVEIDPSLGDHLEKELTAFSRKLGLKLYPLGELDNGHAYIIIDELGGTYIFFDELEKLSNSFDSALEGLLLGKKSEGF